MQSFRVMGNTLIIANRRYLGSEIRELLTLEWLSAVKHGKALYRLIYAKLVEISTYLPRIVLDLTTANPSHHASMHLSVLVWAIKYTLYGA